MQSARTGLTVKASTNFHSAARSTQAEPTLINFIRERIDQRLVELYSGIRRNGEFMPTATTNRNGSIVVSALSLRTNLGKMLRRVDVERRSLVIEKRGTPTAVLMNIRDYVKLAAPEPEVLKIIGEEAKRNKTNALTSRQIDQIIKAARSEKKKH
jgi:prevent-host-death family protein